LLCTKKSVRVVSSLNQQTNQRTNQPTNHP